MVAEFEPAPVMTLRDYSSIVWRRRWLIMLPAAIATIIAAVLTMQQTQQFSASAEVLVRLPPTAASLGSTGAVMSPRLIENELQAAQGSAVRAVVRDLVGSEPQLSVVSSDDSDVFRFSAISSNAQLAARAANTYAEQYIERQKAALISEYGARAEVLTEQLAAIGRGNGDATRRIEYARELEDLAVSTELARTSGAALIDEATAPGSPFAPSVPRNTILAGAIGLLIGLIAAFLLNYLDTSLRDEDDLTRASGQPNLAVIPRIPGTKTADGPQVVSIIDPRSAATEAFRGLHTALRFMSLDRPLKVIQITSPRPGDGKTTVATNLAVLAARSGLRVGLIDCDLRKPQIHNRFELDNRAGFTSVLLDEASLRDVVRFVDGLPNLIVVPSGPIPPNPSELLSSDRAREVLASVGHSADLLILDSPPLLPVADSIALSSGVDGVIVVASAGLTDARQISRAIARLQQVDAPLLGTVLNRFAAVGDVDYYGNPVGEPTTIPERDVDNARS